MSQPVAEGISAKDVSLIRKAYYVIVSVYFSMTCGTSMSGL